MKIKRIGDESLKPEERTAIASYRHKVFVESLRWELPGIKHEHEQDEFDAAPAVHIVAMNDASLPIGYGRLIPTTKNYLLGSLFPHLVEQRALPRAPDVWELSRFTSAQIFGDTDDLARRRTQVGKRILLEAVEFVRARSGREIVFCTTPAIERLALRWGVDLQRLGPPKEVAGDRLVAALIRCNVRTSEALLGRREAASDLRLSRRPGVPAAFS